MLTSAHQKFCEGIISGFTRTAAYASAFPRAQRATAQSHGSKLFRKPHIQAEIARLRGKADEIAGSAVLSNVEIRAFLARIVRSRHGTPGEDSDLGEQLKPDGTNLGIRAREKLLALKLASDLAPPPPEPGPDPDRAAFHEMIRRIRSEPWRPAEIAQNQGGSQEPKKGWQI